VGSIVITALLCLGTSLNICPRSSNTNLGLSQTPSKSLFLFSVQRGSLCDRNGTLLRRITLCIPWRPYYLRIRLWPTILKVSEPHPPLQRRVFGQATDISCQVRVEMSRTPYEVKNTMHPGPRVRLLPLGEDQRCEPSSDTNSLLPFDWPYLRTAPLR
jgi:hypothetical protein